MTCAGQRIINSASLREEQIFPSTNNSFRYLDAVLLKFTTKIEQIESTV